MCISKYHLVLLSILPFLISCKYESSDGVSTNNSLVFDITFDNGDKTSPLSLSQIFDSVSYIPLKNDSGIIIGGIKDIKFVHNRFYIWDNKANALYVFDNKGNYLQEISHIGNASNEHILIGGFDVNPRNEEISLFDSPSRKIKRFSKNGTFLDNLSLKDVIRDFAVLGNGDYVFYTPDYLKGKNRRGAWQTDSSGVFKKQLVSMSDDFLYGGLYPTCFCRINDSTIGLKGGEDHDYIYHITADTIVVKYQLKVDIKIPDEIKKRAILNFENYKGKVYTKNDYFETEKLMTIAVSNLKRRILLFYHKTDSCHWLIQSEKDLVEDIKLHTWFQSSYNKALIGVLDCSYILSFPGLREEFPDIDESSNPILMVVYTK
ncbi:MAG: 6-bladed beta-propeller [Bacteroidales bacterium]|jgi:hypothetical protein|nr:6-bladed beta-propeller [Bacteroidales bacterium]MDI9544968.1 6-bladed beta-propeller [Bacteroidota bacterium]MBP8981770.1 6-bladed beta-propeller [Bacteroidales bacterium]HPB34960.1 6-bladed beta-propeller [Bacteroidales bacterium]HPY57603.1 6-bladed beta-propeller [Bacteroidales bacterium]